MAYMRNNLISRAGYSGDPGMGGILDDLASVGGSVLKFYGTQQAAAGAAQQSNADLNAALAAQQGIGAGTILLLGGVGVVAFLMLRKKKPSST